MATRAKARWLSVLIVSISLLFPAAARASASEDSAVVGRITHAEGQILRHVPDTQDWVSTGRDTPFGMSDALYSEPGARAEIVIPNGIRARMGSTTQIQVMALKPDASEVDVASGVARFYNGSEAGVLKATTPFGYVLAEPESSFDLYVGDESLEVVALEGEVDFVDPVANAGTKVTAGSKALRAGPGQIASDAEAVDEEWDEWNESREDFWNRQIKVEGDSTTFPPELKADAGVLKENGRWERVYHEGRYRELWRPTKVSPSWQPFTVGRWTDWYGDQCWVPDEPFGYMTHHYGNWLMVSGVWYWGPPPAAAYTLEWYPGRVAWIYNEEEVGWIPLAPNEVYYAHNYWGPQSVVARDVAAPGFEIGTLVYYRTAIVVPQVQLYVVQSYAPVRIVNINHTTIIRNYHSARIVDDRVIKNRSHLNDRFNFTNAPVQTRPHHEVTDRIQKNRRHAAGEARAVNASALRTTLAATNRVTPVSQATLPPPRLTNRIVPASQANLPKDQAKFETAEMKRNVKPSKAAAAAAQGSDAPRARAIPMTGPGKIPVQAGARGQLPQGPGDTKVLNTSPPGSRPQGAGQPGAQVSAPLTHGAGTGAGTGAEATGHAPAARWKPQGIGEPGAAQGTQASQPKATTSKPAEQILQQRAFGRPTEPPLTQSPTPEGGTQPMGRKPEPAGTGPSPPTSSSGSSKPGMQQSSPPRPADQTNPVAGPSPRPTHRHSSTTDQSSPTAKPGGPNTPAAPQAGAGQQGAQSRRMGTLQQQPRASHRQSPQQQKPGQQAVVKQKRPQNQLQQKRRSAPGQQNQTQKKQNKKTDNNN